jgi:hypothetical protein
MHMFTFRFLVLFLLMFIANSISAQLQTTWVKTLYYDASASGSPYNIDSFSVGPRGFATRPDGKFFVLSNDDMYQDQSIYLMDSLGSILRTYSVGRWGGLHEWDSYGIVATPDSGCAYFYRDYAFGAPPPAPITYSLKHIAQNGGGATVYSWSNSGYNYPPQPKKVLPSYHQTYYCFFNDNVIEIPNQDTLLKPSLIHVFQNDDMLYEDSLLSRMTYSNTLVWSVPTMGYHIVVASENVLYAINDSLRKYDALTGQLKWTKPLPAGNIFSHHVSTEGLIILDDRNISILDSSGFVVSTNYINLLYREPKVLTSLKDGSILTGGWFRTFVQTNTNEPNYSSFIIKLNSEGNGTVDSSNYFFTYDADNDSVENFVDDAVIVAAALGNSNGHPELNNVFFRGRTCYSSDWLSRFKTGLNFKYSDANFDGIIDTSDIQLVDYLGSSKQRASFIPIHNDTTSQEKIYISIDDPILDIGDTVTISVILGTPIDPIDSIYGLSFYVGISGILLYTVSVEFVNGTLGDTLINLYKHISWNDSEFNAIVLCRTDHQNISMAGDTVFKYKAVISPFLFPGTHQLAFGGHLLTEGGFTIPYQLDTDSLQLILSTQELKENRLKVFPNPANEYLNISDHSIDELRIIDFSGAIILKTEISNGTPVNIKNLPNGLYLVELKNSKYHYFEKLVVIHK